jgi:hypothetical protein
MKWDGLGNAGLAPAFSLEGREGRRKKEEGRRKKEEGRRKKEEGRRKKEEGRRGTLAEASINTRDFLTKIKDPSIIAP